MNDINKRKAAAERRAVRLRNYQRQRGRALARLAQENPARYKELLEQERQRDEAEGKTWLDIYGSTSNSLGGISTPNGRGEVSQQHPNRNQEDESHLE